ncbi:MIT domain-containing protein 1-like [Ornithodoros turicata]|uniref:MIT domain-containing protein 1-like n=1 Tax=Ornithodoros turicata TaxID=34597 RepID=UPI0031392AD1
MAASKQSGMQASAASVLTRAVQYDNEKRYTSALVCYQEGIQLLVDALKGVTDDSRREHLRKQAKTYIDRAEKVKELVQQEKEAGTYHEQIQIEDKSTGHSYESVFGHLLDDRVTSIDVDDPYIRAVHQAQNFLQLCELAVKRCSNLKEIILATGLDQNDPKSQIERINLIKESLAEHGVNLIVQFSETLHDREIRLSNGWIIKIGRGLSYFRPTPNRFSLGTFNHDLRQCFETTVDIFHKKAINSATQKT